MPDDPAAVDAYIDAQPQAVRDVLASVRAAIHAAVPSSGEKISYGMPMVTLDGRNLVSFAVWKAHIGVYPIPEGDEEFQRQIGAYRDAKATARFPLDGPIPYDLIGRLAATAAAERRRG